jgi:signal transduction histidine kinase/ActR/RegA family two-component response regulator
MHSSASEFRPLAAEDNREAAGVAAAIVSHSPTQRRLYAVALWGIAALLASAYPLASGAAYRGNADFHGAIEAVGALLGLVAGLALVGRFVALGNRFHLFVGLAYFVNGAEDIIHGLLSLPAVQHATGIPPAILANSIPGTYVAGRLMMGFLLLAACVSTRWGKESPNPRRETAVTALIVVILSLLATGVAYTIPLPQFVFPGHLIGRPVDLVSAAVLFAAFVALYRRYRCDGDVLTWWLLLSVLVNVVGQVMMSFSQAFYDAFFDVAHIYKVLGYAVPLVGFSFYQIAIISRQVQAGRALSQSKRELQATNAALDAANRVAEAATAAKSEFLANMSHEIRTPMTAILGYAEIMLANAKTPEDVEITKTIKRNGDHLLGIINDILDLSKIEAGKLRVERISCSPVAIVADIASLMRVRAKAKNLPLSIEYDGPIPETVQSDPTRLRQILINLVGNAVKFTQSGNVRLTIRVRPDSSGSPQLQFAVMDTGIGITEEQASRLFQPFSQGDASIGRTFGGTGLGLAISKRLAKMLGGDVTVYSVSGQGSKFTLTIDTGPLDGVRWLERPHETIGEDAQKNTAPPPAEQLEPHCRILLAEDGLDNQRLLAFLLRKAGAEVAVADNGQAAVELALAANSQDRPFAVILMDMQMPVVDGYEATRRLRAAGYAGPIVALTAHAMKEDRQKCLDAGCDDYLPKPIDRHTLLAAVAKHLAGQPQSQPA